jgi:hypothetical protein
MTSLADLATHANLTHCRLPGIPGDRPDLSWQVLGERRD